MLLLSLLLGPALPKELDKKELEKNVTKYIPENRSEKPQSGSIESQKKKNVLCAYQSLQIVGIEILLYKSKFDQNFNKKS